MKMPLLRRDFEKLGIVADRGIKVSNLSDAFKFSKNIIKKILEHAKKCASREVI